jgi:ABC-type enterobactin transport system permease subunit
MSLTLSKIIWSATKWIASVVALAGVTMTALFVYDLLNRDRWGYPWWLLIVLLGITVTAWALRREATLVLLQFATQDDATLYLTDEETT